MKNTIHLRGVMFFAVLLCTLGSLAGNISSVIPDPGSPGSMVTNIEAPRMVTCGFYDIDVTARDFTNVGAISLVLNYDPLVFSYQAVVLNPQLSQTDINGSISGQFRLGYYGDGISLDSDAILFTLRFKILTPASGAITNLSWSKTAGDCEYASLGGAEVYTGNIFNDLSWTIIGTQVCSEFYAFDDEGGSVKGYSGGISVADVLLNDLQNGSPVSPADVSVTFVSSTHSGVYLSGGSVIVAPGTPAGDYSLVYQVCLSLYPDNCDEATVTVPVSACEKPVISCPPPVIAYPNDGCTAVGVSLGTPLTRAECGVKSVVNNAPSAFPPGETRVTWTVTDNSNQTAYCMQSVFVPSIIQAENDAGALINGLIGGTSFVNVLSNDYMGCNPASLDNVSITLISTTHPNVTLSGTNVAVAGGTPTGTYFLTYGICEKLTGSPCDQAIVTVSVLTVVPAPVIDAIDDQGSPVKDYTGGTSVDNVLTNDLFNGIPVIPADIILTPVSSTHSGVSLIGSRVNVAPGTPAGNYALVYQICELLNPANCDQASVLVPVAGCQTPSISCPPTLTVNPNDGCSAVEVSLGIPVTAAECGVKSVTNNAPSAFPPGATQVTWTVTDNSGNTASCIQTVVVTDLISAENDTGSLINGWIGGTSLVNVLSNDMMGCNPAGLDNVTLKFISSTHPNVTLTGTSVSVAAGTPTGSYFLTYEICGKLTGTPCDQAIVTVMVLTIVPAPVIDAIDDSGSPVNGATGGVALEQVLTNDLLNGIPVIPADVNISLVSSTHSGVSLSGGSVLVAPGTPAGNYSLVYQICEVLNPDNCDTAIVTVPVTGCEKPVIICPPPITTFTNDGCTASGVVLVNPFTSDNSGVASITNDAPSSFPTGETLVTWIVTNNCGSVNTCTQTVTVISAILAVNDTGTVIDGLKGGTSLINVLSNDILNCNKVSPDQVIITFISSSNKEKIYLAGADVIVSAGIATGNYKLVYQVCEKGNPSNCSIATVTVPVLTTVPAPLIVAVDDGGSVNGLTGGIAVTNILANDKLNGMPVDPSEVSLTSVNSAHTNISISGFSVIVAAGTPAGTYTLTYRICEKLNPSNCDEAIVTVIVVEPISMPIVEAVDDEGVVNGMSGGTAISDVLANDKLNGKQVNPAEVFVTESVPDPTGYLSLNADRRVTVAPGTPPGTYFLNYKICEVLNPDNCDEARVMVRVKSGLNTSLVVTKVAVETSYSAVGDLIHYQINVLNSDPESTFYNILISDPDAVIATGNPIGNLAPGTEANITAVHTVTQADLDAVSVRNTATARGSDHEGISFISTSNTVTVNGLQRPQITITKFATESAFFSAGEVIHYSFEVFNCGNVTTENIIISDRGAILLEGSPVVSLAPRHTVTAKAEYVVSQDDVDAGIIANIATAEGVDPKGNPVRDDSNEVTLYSDQPTQLVITQFAEESSFSAVGDVIHYSILVKNYMKTTLSDVVTTDPSTTITSGSPVFRLASGETVIVTGFHTVTQKDLDAGMVVNSATVRARDFYGNTVKQTSNEVTVFAKQSPDLMVTKTAEESSYSSIGDRIHYNHQIKNTGNVMITGLLLTDPNNSDTGNVRIDSLSPGESVGIRTAHTITQADLNMGMVGKQASISGYDANGQPVRAISNEVIVNGVQNAQLATTLTSAENTFIMEGDIIHYTIEVRNTGNVTLTNLWLTDATACSGEGKSITGMAPGTIYMLTAEHMVTQSNLAAGKVVNQATVAGYNPLGGKVSGMSLPLTIAAGKTEHLTVANIAQESGYARVGEVIHYSITIKNNGKVPIWNISVTVPGAVLSGSGMIASLPAFESAPLLAMHTITQADLDAGQISLAAEATGQYPDGMNYAEISNPVTIYGIQDATLKTTISSNETSFTYVGQEITYSVLVENAGNVTLTDIGLFSQDNLTLSTGPSTLAPGSSAELSAIYKVSLADLDAGKIIKMVQATGKDPDKQPVAMTSNNITLMGLQNPELSTIASVLENTFSKVGEVIHYGITVKNSGNVSIISTAVTDPNAIVTTPRPNTILLPDESFSAAAVHVVTQDDLDAGKVITAAKSEGFDLNGNTITKVGNTILVQAIQRYELDILTSAIGQDFKNTGEIIDYSIQVTNLGNTTVFNLDVIDPNAVISLQRPVPELLPGESVVVAASHLVTQDDMNAGKVENAARAAGVDLYGHPIEKSGNRVTVIGLQKHELTAQTGSSVTTYKREGEAVTYTVWVSNTGNVTLNHITVTDAEHILRFSNEIAALAPGESASIVSEYTISSEDIHAGRIVTAPEITCYDTNNRKFIYKSNDVTVLMVIEKFNLSNFPNPFSAETTIVFDLPEKGEVVLKVYDVQGREVWQTERKEYSAGRNYVNWKSNRAPTGLYFMKMVCNGNQATRTMSVIN